ncbi:MAG: response regulator [Caldilineaceae bacterium]|nr:response regulator [Caldilineaceae bacterium]
MRILSIEDEPAIIKNLRKKLSGLSPNLEIIAAKSKSSGVSAIQKKEFDFIICDLRIPPHDNSVAVDENHGLAVRAMAKKLCPGTPCLFFTGYATIDNISDELSHGEMYDILGTGKPYPMTRLLTKDKFSQCIKLLTEFNSELATLDSINIDCLGDKVNLDKMEKRALRLLARPLEGTSVEVQELKGLSGARTLRINAKNQNGQVVASQFAKIGDREKLRKEQERYQRYVEPLLGVGHSPTMGRKIVAGIGKREALFYQFADDYPDTLFDVLRVSECDATTVVESLREILKPWTKLSEEKMLSLHELREERISKAELSPFLEALGPVEAQEEVEQQVRTSCQHGDLHGFNVLCNASGGAVVIDFGNVGPAPACVDPVLLELSVLFHKESPFRNGSWPTIEQTESWFDIEAYLRGCPFPKFIKKCREWASENGGYSGLPMVVYAEAIRQLKYESTDQHRALGIVRAAIRELT